jgi:SAM-dependent methyltransferase
MPTSAGTGQNWFDRGGAEYARFRPQYPPALAAYLASVAPDRVLALDVGCGTGQLTLPLAREFERVVGADPGADQLANARPHERVLYVRAGAEHLPVADHSASLIAAAQAAHWFKLPAFYKEVRRVARKRGILALISYGVLSLEPPLDQPFRRFYGEVLGPYWPPERKLVDAGYAGMPFPFAELAAPQLEIEVEWTLPEFLGYVSTWSALLRAQQAGRPDLLHAFARELAPIWGEAGHKWRIRWPLNMRVGTV